MTEGQAVGKHAVRNWALLAAGLAVAGIALIVGGSVPRIALGVTLLLLAAISGAFARFALAERAKGR